MTHPSQEEVVEEIISLLPKTKIIVDVGEGETDMVDLEEVLPYELHRILTTFAQTIREEERELWDKMIEKHLGADSSTLRCIRMDRDDPEYIQSLTPTTNYTGETNPQENMTTEDIASIIVAYRHGSMSDADFRREVLVLLRQLK